MTSQQSRKKEAEVVAHLHYEDTYKQVFRINELLGREARWASLLQRIRAFGTRSKMNEIVSVVDDRVIPQTKADSQQFVEFGQRIIATLKEDERKGWPASRYKLRTQWIASLVSSGALPGWTTQLCDSADGSQTVFRKDKASEDPENGGGLRFTETELQGQFEKGIPMRLGSPEWSTSYGGYPRVSLIPNIDRDGVVEGYTELKVPPVRHSILTQFAKAERTKLANGSLSTKVVISNRFTDGGKQEKEIVDDSSRVFQEVNNAYASMIERTHAVALATQDMQYEKQEKQLREQEGLENDGD